MARAKQKTTKPAPAAQAKPDPIFAAIEAHRVAYAKMDHALGLQNALDEGKDKRRFAVAERKADKAVDVESDAQDALRATRPQTIEGLAALSAYLRAREYEAHWRSELVPLLRTFERATAKLAKPPHSEDFRRALKLVAAIDAERKKRHAAWLKQQRSPAVKRARAEDRRKNRLLKKGPTVGQVEMLKRVAVVVQKLMGGA